MQDTIDYLRAALPEADRIILGEDGIVRIVRGAAALRERMPWTIPEDLFRAYVLFPRINNERPADYRAYLTPALMDRVQGLSMTDAAQEVNLWCAEHADYAAADGRTADALTVLRRTFGRCGEESTLLTSALRSVGIPARQVYAPRWSHCDDNHAWVEAWVDGEWHYMGACEPEPVMDSGWFTAAASKAMLVHTRAFGLDPDGERVEYRIGNIRIINRTAAYAETRKLTVRVTEGGRPASGIIVRFEIANMGEFYPICQKTTGADGTADLLTGLGSLHLAIHDGSRMISLMADAAEDSEITADMRDASCRDVPAAFVQRPPKETRVQPMLFRGDTLRAHRERLNQ